MSSTTTDPVTAAFEKALAIANRFRAKLGEKPVDKVLPGIMGDMHHCTLATTFNADAQVSYEVGEHAAGGEAWDADDADQSTSYGGSVTYAERKTAERFAEACNEVLDPVAPFRAVPVGGDRSRYRVDLPDSITQIAVDFDNSALDAEWEYIAPIEPTTSKGHQYEELQQLLEQDYGIKKDIS